jgi:hypothetical protein
MQKISFGFTHGVAGDLGYVWDDEVLAIMFGKESGRADYTVYDIRMGGNPLRFEHLADALNAMLSIAAKYKASL